MPKKEIRIIQLIDSLEPGGAERMAVTIANSLVDEVGFSGLVVTRVEGHLKATVKNTVSYFFLNKKKRIDVLALLRFRKYVKQHKVTHIHAHGSSYFFAILLKLTLPTMKVFWHDHLGNRPFETRSNFFIKSASFLFSGVFVVNETLRDWGLKHLKTPNVYFLPNYVEENTVEEQKTFLQGTAGKRIVILANLRHPKNHSLAIDAFLQSEIALLGWTLHLVGKDSSDEYSSQLKRTVFNANATSSVFLYGSCSDVQHILSQSTVGLLTSSYEGFPVTLIEYGKAKLLVVTSDVGYCSQIIKNNKTGFTFTSESTSALVEILKDIANKYNDLHYLASNLNTFVKENYQAKQVVRQLLVGYQNEL